MKIAIIGSRKYENKRKIKEMIFELKQRFGDKLIIISGGAKDGADKYAKKYAIEFGISYKEYNPAHTPRNLYSAMPNHYYGKQYHVSQFFHRNGLIAKDCDIMVGFIPDGVKSNGSQDALKQAKKLDKNIIIIN